MSIAQLVEEINALPPDLRQQVLRFIAFQKTQAQAQLLAQQSQPDAGEETSAAPNALDN